MVELANRRYNKPVIVGPTASGKTGLAIKLAKQYGGEVISADSRAIYKYADIGTAKPTPKEQDSVPHWGLDIVGPGERFTVYDFQQYALAKIKDIRKRGRIPFLVGGSGLYVDAVIYGYNFASCKKVNMPDRGRISNNFAVVGIATDKNELKTKISKRADSFFNNEIIAETELILKEYGANSQLAKSNIYPIISQYLQDKITLNEAKELSIKSDMALVKKQLTWFKRNPQITWLKLDEIEPYVGQIVG
ncbi:tRNA (adenosine(37)-N6)-dimethylallyltransferase MiaA [Candidatus Saccharibacteria bacterium]|nr:tRNA (adenosine(37)-N6)-dimethylallyltransferase MiaA [Candidatus Saccharibacteria bacterium]